MKTIIVSLTDKAIADSDHEFVAEKLMGLGAQDIEVLLALGAITCTVPDEVRDQVAAIEGVAAIEDDVQFHLVTPV